MTDTNSSKQSPVEATREAAGRRVSPPVDIFENAESFLIVADLPGVEAGSTRVEFNPPELLVGGKAPGVDYERRFELGSGVDAGSISAQLKHGVLTIELKKSAQLRRRKVEVRAA